MSWATCFAGLVLGIPRATRRTRQAAFKSRLGDKVKEVQAAHPGAKVTLWSMDEHRVGLKPILRRVWTRKGTQPIALGWHRFESLQVSAFVEPETGENHWWLHDKVNVPTFEFVLRAFADAVGTGAKHRVVVVLDGAGWHTSKKLVVPDGIHLHHLPPYSPELQPAERLWSLSDEPLVNKYFKALDDIREALNRRCADLKTRQAEVQGRTLFHWWPILGYATIY